MNRLETNEHTQTYEFDHITSYYIISSNHSTHIYIYVYICMYVYMFLKSRVIGDIDQELEAPGSQCSWCLWRSCGWCCAVGLHPVSRKSGNGRGQESAALWQPFVAEMLGPEKQPTSSTICSICRRKIEGYNLEYYKPCQQFWKGSTMCFRIGGELTGNSACVGETPQYIYTYIYIYELTHSP